MSTTHKWKMTDKPHQIAKKYKFKKFDEIWDAPGNKKLKSSRKKPENIKKGDVVVIPPTPKELEEIAKQIAELAEKVLWESIIANKLAVNAQIYQEAYEVFGRYIKESNGFYLRLEGEIDGNLKTVQKWGDGVDLAKDLIMMGRGLGNLAKMAKKSTVATGQKLKDINNKALSEAVGLAKAPVKLLENMAKKALSDHLKKTGSDEIKMALGAIEAIDKSFEKMQKPSFWALTVASLLEGKSVSKSVTRDLVEEKNQQKARISTQRMQEIGKMAKIRAQMEKMAKRCRKAQTESEARLKLLQKQLKSLPAP